MRYSVVAILIFVLGVGLFLMRNLMAENETLSQRRARLRRMSDVEKTRLLEQKEKFEDLSAEQQERYHTLHKKLVNDPQYKQLHVTLQRYRDWFATITPTHRAELTKLPPRKRLQRVKALMDEQAAERFRLMVSQVFKSKKLLDRKDLNVICDWTDQFLRRHADEILATIDDQERLAKIKAKLDWEKDVRWLRFLYFRAHPRRFRGPPGFTPPNAGSRDREAGNRVRESGKGEEDGETPFDRLPQPSPEEVAELKSRVSRQARDVLEKATEEGEQARMIQNWMRAAFLSRIMPPVNRRDLDRFVRESLSKEEREWLESMPRERMYHELRKLYFRKRMRDERRRRGGRGQREDDRDFNPPGDRRQPPERDRAGTDRRDGDAGFDKGPPRGGRPADREHRRPGPPPKGPRREPRKHRNRVPNRFTERPISNPIGRRGKPAIYFGRFDSPGWWFQPRIIL